jgi:hypothetical protein
MIRDPVAWLFVFLFMFAGIILAVVHADSVAQCRATLERRGQ